MERGAGNFTTNSFTISSQSYAGGKLIIKSQTNDSDGVQKSTHGSLILNPHTNTTIDQNIIFPENIGTAGTLLSINSININTAILKWNDSINIADNGNIGIGTNTPSTLLELSGNEPYLTLTNTTEENTDGGAETKIIFNDHSATSLAQIQASHDGTSDDTKGNLIFSTNNGTSINEALRIDSSGNVGIGTTNPTSALHLHNNTSSLFDAFRVSNSGNSSNFVIQKTSRKHGFDYNTCLFGHGIEIDSSHTNTNGADGKFLIRSDGSSVIGGSMVIENGELSLYSYLQTSTSTDQNVLSSAVSNMTLFPTDGGVSIGHKISGVAKLDVNGSILSRGVGSASGKLMLNDSSNNYNISLQPPTLSSSYTLTLPTTDGNNNQVLQTDGSGTLSWVDQTAAISNLSDIGDVSSASPSTNDALVWDGSSWSPSAVASGSNVVFNGTTTSTVGTGNGGKILIGQSNQSGLFRTSSDGGSYSSYPLSTTNWANYIERLNSGCFKNVSGETRIFIVTYITRWDYSSSYTESWFGPGTTYNEILNGRYSANFFRRYRPTSMGGYEDIEATWAIQVPHNGGFGFMAMPSTSGTRYIQICDVSIIMLGKPP